MSELATPHFQSKSVGSHSIQVTSRNPPPNPEFAIPTLGSGFAPFDKIKKCLSDKPLRIRVADNPEIDQTVEKLAEQWLEERSRGTDVAEMIETPSYQRIVGLRHRAIRPLLLMLRNCPDHWFPALSAITGENPVPSESEGSVKEMTHAWIKWGKERGYIGELD
jgi:hypothetical protein